MLILGMDTSSAISVALITTPDVSEESTVLAAKSMYDPRRHAELLMPTVVEVLRSADVKHSELDAIAVGTGPGPFTGLRVGIVTARTFALALGRPVYGTCSLDALARAGYRTMGTSCAAQALTATSDARRRELYWSNYQPDLSVDGAWTGDVVRVDGPHVGPASQVNAAGSVVGRGPGLYPDAFPRGALVDDGQGDVVSRSVDVDAADIAALVAIRLNGLRSAPLNVAEELDETMPRYLRRPDVAAPGQRKRAS